MKKALINYTDFQKVDIRVGEIKSAQHLEGSRNLLQLHVDFGEDYGLVEILSGIADYYKPEILIGKKYLFVTNLEPKKMLGRESNGMILVIEDEKKPILLSAPKRIKNGQIIR